MPPKRCGLREFAMAERKVCVGRAANFWLMRRESRWVELATCEQTLLIVLMNRREEKKTFCPATCAKLQPNCVSHRVGAEHYAR
jgi:hypothetical protein